MIDPGPTVSAVIIGRNEGARLLACLASLGQDLERIIYVDSGSTDGSVAAARNAGAEIVVLDTDTPFTAARARNAGIAALEQGIGPDLVQFIDGDCTLDPDWIRTATAFLMQNPKVAAVCGRRRERAPDVSVYNRMCDAEWDTPVGEAKACGGDALIRMQALSEVGGYNPNLIAGEEPEMCLRMRRMGWVIWRLDAEMTLHDAAMTTARQFFSRARRAGYAAAEGAAMYGASGERHGVATTCRALVWGLVLPVIILLSYLMFGPLALWMAVIYPAQVVRLALRDGGSRFGWERGLLLTLGKFAECRGVLDYCWRRWRGHDAELIEYK